MKLNSQNIEMYDDHPAKLKVGWREHGTRKKHRIAREKMYYHIIDFWRECDYFLKKSIGQDFDDVFHKFCQKYNKVVCDINTRDYFLKQFEPKFWNWGYYIDDNNIVRYEAIGSKKKPILYALNGDDVVVMIEVNHKVIRDDIFAEYFWNKLGRESFTKLYTNRFITPQEYRKIRAHFGGLGELIYKYSKKYKKNPYSEWADISAHENAMVTKAFGEYVDAYDRSVFREVVVSGVVTYAKGDRVYKKLKAELLDRENKNIREKRKKAETAKETLLRDIETIRKSCQ